MANHVAMSSLLWFFNRASAALVGLVVVAVVVAVIYAPVSLFQCGRTCTNDLPNAAAVGLWLVYATVEGLSWTLPTAIVLGIVPATATLTITPAATHPWRALPILLVATLVGVAICFCLLYIFRMEYGAAEAAMLLAIPSLTGLLAAWQLKRFWCF